MCIRDRISNGLIRDEFLRLRDHGFAAGFVARTFHDHRVVLEVEREADRSGAADQVDTVGDLLRWYAAWRLGGRRPARARLRLNRRGGIRLHVTHGDIQDWRPTLTLHDV